MILTKMLIFIFEEKSFVSRERGRQFSHEIGYLPMVFFGIMYSTLPVMFTRGTLSSARAHSEEG